MFDYQCVKCEKKIEDVIEPWTATPAPKDCPSCGAGGSAIRVDFYQTWFNYMGMGWNHSTANCTNHKI